MSEETKEPEYRDFLFKACREGAHTYILLDKDYVNDGSPARGENVIYKAKFGPGLPGTIYRVKTSNGGETVHYNKKSTSIVVGIWKDRDQIDKWRATQQAVDLSEKLKKDASKDSLMNLLEPIQRAYQDCRNRSERAALLARIIAYITSN